MTSRTITHKKLMYGNGCYHHKDCFTCPFDDCILSGSHPHARKSLTKKACTISQKGVN